MDKYNVYSTDNQQMIDMASLFTVLTSVTNNLQDEVINGNISSNKVPKTLILERLEEEMRRKEFIDTTIGKIGIPKQIGDGRYAWRPWGKKGLYVRGKTLDEVYSKAFKEYQRLEHCQSMTLQQALDKFIEFNKDLDENTHDKSQKDFNKFAKNLLNTPLDSLSALAILKEYKKVVADEHPCATTVSNYRGELRRTLEHVCEHHNQKLTFDITKLNKELIQNTKSDYLLKSDEVLLLDENKDCYTQEEAKKMIELAKEMDTIRGYASITTLLIGVRISEICGLKKCNVDLETGVINIFDAAKYKRIKKTYEIGDPKKEKFRRVILSDFGIEIFKRIFELAPDSEYVFPDVSDSKQTEYLATYKVSEEIAKMCTKLGMIVKSNHDQRRTYDTMLAMACIPDALRKKLMGHKTPKREIDGRYIRIEQSYSSEELRATLNSAFDNFYRF